MTELIRHQDELDERIYHYKRAGESFASIANTLGITQSEVIKGYRRYMVDIVSEYSLTEREHIVAMELHRLDELMTPFYTAGTTGDKEGAEVTLKIMAHRAKLLRLDQPTPEELSRNAQIIVVTGTKEEFEQALREGQQKRQVTSRGRDDEGDKEDA